MGVETLVQQVSRFATPRGLSVRVQTGFLEAASQSYLTSSLVIASSGKVAVGTNGMTAAILGFAAKKAVGTTNANVDIYPAGGLEFEATLEDQSAGDHALLQADLFAQFGVRVTATGLWYINYNDTSNKIATIVELVDKVGTIQGRVRARLYGTGILLAQ